MLTAVAPDEIPSAWVRNWNSVEGVPIPSSVRPTDQRLKAFVKRLCGVRPLRVAVVELAMGVGADVDECRGAEPVPRAAVPAGVREEGSVELCQQVDVASAHRTNRSDHVGPLRVEDRGEAGQAAFHLLGRRRCRPG